ncbi:MAG: hypothetical protein HKN36_11525 [Hellea sp.]|nr:hypothetical protein [Hellea sp.]
MPKIHVVRSAQINAPVSKVYDIVSDLGQWTPWSPWLIMDPDAKVDVKDGGKFYRWEGNRVGTGTLEVISEDKNQRVEFDLKFLAPWKSEAKTWMQVEPNDGGTKLSWYMDSSLPFFMFFMKKMMVAFIGMDYERGLKMLRNYAEDGKVHSSLSFDGVRDYAGTRYAGIRRKISTDDIETAMTEDFTALGEWTGQGNDVTKNVFCIYHKFDIVKGVVDYTAAVTFDELPEDIPEGFVTGTHTPTRLLTVTHTGPYEHLGNGWTAGMYMLRNKEYKGIKRYHPFETYANDPHSTDPKDLITHINFPVK